MAGTHRDCENAKALQLLNIPAKFNDEDPSDLTHEYSYELIRDTCDALVFGSSTEEPRWYAISLWTLMFDESVFQD